MAATATYDDANLILRLYEMRREERMRKAREWFGGEFKVKTLEEFQKLCPPGSGMNASYRMVVSYWEMAASFITSGVLNQTLFFQSGTELLFVWERIRDIVPALRESTKNPTLWKNLEIVAESYMEHMKKQAPEFQEAFAKRVRG